MARRGDQYSIKACEKWLAQGRGRGIRETYKPWVRIGDFSSRGVSTAVPGIKVKRIHELLSGIETRAFLVAEFNKDVIDIREQFPLLPLDHVVALAQQVGITYPHIRGEPFTLTTDLVITRRVDGVTSYHAVAVKPMADLLKKSIRDKLELERLWWNSLGVEWLLCTENDVSQAVEDNLTWVSQEFRSHEFDYASVNTWALTPFIEKLEPRRYLIGDLIVQIAETILSSPQEAKIILCKAIWEHYVTVDLEVSIPNEGIISILDWQFDQTDERGGLDDCLAK